MVTGWGYLNYWLFQCWFHFYSNEDDLTSKRRQKSKETNFFKTFITICLHENLYLNISIKKVLLLCTNSIN